MSNHKKPDTYPTQADAVKTLTDKGWYHSHLSVGDKVFKHATLHGFCIVERRKGVWTIQRY